jgi:hypothetical protein
MIMKKLAAIFSILFFVSINAACATSAATSGDKNKMLEPGDTIGDFLITTGVERNFTYGFDIDCPEMSEVNTFTCQAKVGEAVNVSTGLYDDTGSGKLDEILSHSKYQIFIDDRPVDLQAFGTIAYNHPSMGAIYFINVVINASTPGEITVKDEGVFDNGDPFTSTSTYVFSEP